MHAVLRGVVSVLSFAIGAQGGSAIAAET